MGLSPLRRGSASGSRETVPNRASSSARYRIIMEPGQLPALADLLEPGPAPFEIVVHIRIAILPAHHCALFHRPHTITVLVVCFLPSSRVGALRWLVTTYRSVHPQRPRHKRRSIVVATRLPHSIVSKRFFAVRRSRVFTRLCRFRISPIVDFAGQLLLASRSCGNRFSFFGPQCGLASRSFFYLCRRPVGLLAPGPPLIHQSGLALPGTAPVSSIAASASPQRTLLFALSHRSLSRPSAACPSSLKCSPCARFGPAYLRKR